MTTAAAQMDRFVEAMEAGDPDRAMEHLERAIRADPTFAPAWGARGLLLSHLGRGEEALSCFDRVLSLQPGHAAAWFSRGCTLQSMGRLDDALTSFEGAFEVDPSHSDAMINAGRLHDDRGRHAEAIALYDRALAIAPTDEMAWANKGNSLVALGREREALTCYERALACDEGSAGAWQGRVWALSNLGLVDEANRVRPIGAPFDRGELHIIRTTAGAKTLALQWFDEQHSHPELVAEVARAMIDWVAGIAARDASLGPSTTLQYGAVPLHLRPRGDELVICMPDLDRPGQGALLVDMTFALQLVVMQSTMHRLIGANPESWALTDTIDVMGFALDEPDVRVRRLRKAKPGESGCVVAPLRPGKAQGLDKVPLTSVARVRPHVLKVLGLPVGWSAELEEHQVTSVKDETGKERLSANR